MIRRLDSYSAGCDHCGNVFCHPHEGWTICGDAGILEKQILDNGWHIGDGEQGEEGKWYCRECYHINEKDEFCLHPAPVAAIEGMEVRSKYGLTQGVIEKTTPLYVEVRVGCSKFTQLYYPSVRTVHDGLRVIFLDDHKRLFPEQYIIVKPGQKTLKMDQKKEMILGYMRKDPGRVYSPTEIGMKMFNLPYVRAGSFASNILRALEEDGLVIRYNGTYSIKT